MEWILDGITTEDKAPNPYHTPALCRQPDPENQTLATSPTISLN